MYSRPSKTEVRVPNSGRTSRGRDGRDNNPDPTAQQVQGQKDEADWIMAKAPTFSVKIPKPGAEPVTDVQVKDNGQTEIIPAETVEWKSWELECISYFIEQGFENQSEAYRRARPIAKKWKPETVHPKASAFFALDKVRARIQESREVMSEEALVDAKYVATRTKMIVERCMDLEPIKDAKGNPLLMEVEAEDGTKQVAALCSFNPNAALKGLDLLGKAVPGYYQGEALDQGSGGSGNINIQVNFLAPGART